MVPSLSISEGARLIRVSCTVIAELPGNIVEPSMAKLVGLAVNDILPAARTF